MFILLTAAQVLLIEPHTHFHHIFTFPRFAVVSGQEHKAFIPYSGTFSSAPNEASHAVVPARVLSVQSRSLKLDREWQGSDEIQFDYLVVATGTTLTPPATTKHDEKLPSIMCLRKHQEQVKRANSILVVGGGAAGVQTAADIKECYPDKQVTLVHSRDRLMPKFDPKLHDIIKRRFDELGISLITGARVVIPPGGFPSTNQTSFDVRITNAPTVSAEFVILATGQQPNNLLVANLGSSSSGQSIINPKNGFIRVRPTLQLADSMYDHLFAVGDIADTGLHKAARPGVAQARVAAQNILALLEGRLPGEEFPVLPPAIHITLGMVL